MSITFVTTTSYGTWLPGDLRGYVREGLTLPDDPQLLKMSRRLLRGDPVYFDDHQRDVLFDALGDTCREFGYRLSDATVEAWHLHWIVWHGDDTIDVMMGRLKTRMRQALKRGRIWTAGYCAEPLFDTPAIETAQAYIARHDGCRMTDGRVVARRKEGNMIPVPPAKPGADGLNHN